MPCLNNQRFSPSWRIGLCWGIGSHATMCKAVTTAPTHYSSKPVACVHVCVADLCEGPLHVVGVVVVEEHVKSLGRHVPAVCVCVAPVHPSVSTHVRCMVCNVCVPALVGFMVCLFLSTELRGELYDCRFNGSCFPLGESLPIGYQSVCLFLQYMCGTCVHVRSGDFAV